ncbi:MAG: AAA family ATPase [Chloroflexota bacterium]|nr:AAA family ATPase [Chloroflexota bacterium]
MSRARLTHSVDRILRALPVADQTTAAPVLFIISGLPGTGKSFLARQISARLAAVIVESDFVRKTLADGKPTYTRDESAFVHRVAHVVIEQMLDAGYHVIYDATNLAEEHREKAYRLADKTGARAIVICTVAPEPVIRARLAKRFVDRDPRDLSDADWEVLELLKRELEPVRRPHLVIDTSGDIDQALNRILRAAR